MLIILPCAGGSAGNYSGYKQIPGGMFAYEYPGHWTRFDETLKCDEDYMIRSLFTEISEGKYGEKINLLGHSMGGLLAWKLAGRLVAEGFNVETLYIAACCAPGVYPDFVREMKCDEDIKMLLRSIRQVPEKVLESSFFNDNLLPVIRNDFDIVRKILSDEKYHDPDMIPVDIVCLFGNSDPIVRREDMLGWQNCTDRRFDLMEFEGDHFFLYDKKNEKRFVGTKCEQV